MEWSSSSAVGDRRHQVSGCHVTGTWQFLVGRLVGSNPSRPIMDAGNTQRWGSSNLLASCGFRRVGSLAAVKAAP